MKKLYIIIYCILISFGFFSIGNHPAVFEKGPYIEKDLKPYVDEWLKDANKYNADLSGYYELDSITFKTFVKEPHVLGKCWIHDKRIEITTLDSLNRFQLHVIMYHELGHCALDKSHTCDRTAIMNPNFKLKNYMDYYKEWNYLIDDYWDGRGLPCWMFGYLRKSEKSSCNCE